MSVLKAAIAAGRLMVRAATWSCRAGRPFIAASSVSMALAWGSDALFIVAPDISVARKAAAWRPTCCSTAASLAWFSGVGAARYSTASRRSAWIIPSKVPVGWPVAFFSVFARARLMAVLAVMLVVTM